MSRALLLLALLAPLGACAKPEPLPGAEPRPAPVDESQLPASLVVENTDFKEYRIFVVNDGGMQIRLGMVSGNSVAEFRLPDSFVRSGQMLRFLAIPLAAPDQPTTQRIMVRPGEQITIRINP